MDEINTSSVNSLTEEESLLLEAALVEAHEGTNNILPENSPTLLIDESTSRFSSALWFDKIASQTVLLAGLGGIGSYVAFLLSRLKLNRLIIYDNDIVDETNLSGQLYSKDNIGLSKTYATSLNCINFSNYHSIISSNGLYDTESPTCNIMICGFDNMAARRLFFTKWKMHVLDRPKDEQKDCLFIDGRLAAEEFQVFCIKGTDTFLMNKYEREWLFFDDQAEITPCSYKQTSFCANMIASVMVNLFVNFIANQCDPLIERELPFYTRYDAERMYFKTETV